MRQAETNFAVLVLGMPNSTGLVQLQPNGSFGGMYCSPVLENICHRPASLHFLISSEPPGLLIGIQVRDTEWLLLIHNCNVRCKP